MKNLQKLMLENQNQNQNLNLKDKATPYEGVINLYGTKYKSSNMFWFYFGKTKLFEKYY